MDKTQVIRSYDIFRKVVPYGGMIIVPDKDGILVNTGGIIGFNSEGFLDQNLDVYTQTSQALANLKKCIRHAGELNGLYVDENPLSTVIKSSVELVGTKSKESYGLVQSILSEIRMQRDLSQAEGQLSNQAPTIPSKLTIDNLPYGLIKDVDEHLLTGLKKSLFGRLDFESVDRAYLDNKMPIAGRTSQGTISLPFEASVQITTTIYLPKR